jgi:hypothetical protein
MKQFLFLAFLAIATLAQTGCRKDTTGVSDDPTVTPINNNQPTVTASVMGFVTTESGTPMPNTTVNIAGRTAKTNAAGVFTLKNALLPVQTVVTCAPTGYFKSLRLLELKANKTAQVNLIMQTKTVLQTFSASAGTTVNVGTQGATVALPANGYKDGLGNAYNGQVQVSARFVNTATPNFVAIAPGTMSATNAQGKAVQLATYGMMEVLLTAPSGAALQLANGKKATISSPIAAGQNAPATIPMWYLEESTGLWKEEGVATKQGNKYIAEVAHFTWWNCDFQGERATIKGRAVDCNGNPVANIYVKNSTGGYGMTDGDGYFEGGVPSGYALTIRFVTDQNQCNTSAYNHTENVPLLSTGQVYQMGTINVGCPSTTNFKTITGHIEGCNGQAIAAAGVIVAGRFTLIDANGNFSITLCSSQLGTNVTVSATTLDDFYTTTVAIGTASTYDVGTMTVCGNTSGIAQDNEFTINGDGFTNQRVVFPSAQIYRDSVIGNTSFHSLSANTSLANVSGLFTSVPTISNWVNNAQWNQLGLNFYIYNGANNREYAPVSGITTVTSITPTQIIGTYSGTVRNQQTNATATITNGRFRATR